MKFESFPNNSIFLLKCQRKQTNSKDDSKKGKKIFSKKNKEKGSSKWSQVECFNYGGKWNFILDFPTPKKNKSYKWLGVIFKSNDNKSTGSTKSKDNNNLVVFTTFFHSSSKIESPNKLSDEEERKFDTL